MRRRLGTDQLSAVFAGSESLCKVAPGRYKVTAMCLAIPGKVVSVAEENGLRMGRVDFGGVVKRVCLDYVPEVEVGDYTIVHVGFALSKIDEAEALRTLAVFEQLGVLEDELAEGDVAFERAAKAPQMIRPDASDPKEPIQTIPN